MNQYKCKNKRCGHEFYSSETTSIINCPVCKTSIFNRSKIINKDNWFWMDTMLKNIEHFGQDNTLKMIDDLYHNPIVRSKIRQLFFRTIETLNQL